jgi:predicted GH43/DUF377 family glycosyl hydrolase
MMPVKWNKLGRVFETDNNHPWMLSHAANPVAEHLHDDVFRLYFSCRDSQSRSHIGYAEVDLKPNFRVLSIAEEPILAPGEVGTFDDSGVSISCLKQINGRKFLYYLGWNLGVTVPWRNSIGLAVYEPSTKTFQRFSKAPLLDRHDVDPYSVSYPFVLEDEGMFRMWYGSNLRWGKDQKDMAHIIKYAESEDAIRWRRHGIVALHFKNEDEYAISRPCVIKEDGLYKMWYSYRGQSYRIGYAESEDGLKWERKDADVGIDVSEVGWDSQMVEYPFVFDHQGKRYMLYNGNNYGKTGIGLAVLARDR